MNKSSWIDKKGFRIAAPIVFGILFVLFWQFGGLHWLLHLRAYDFPLPTQIIDVFATQYAVLWKHTVITAGWSDHWFCSGIRSCRVGILVPTVGIWRTGIDVSHQCNPDNGHGTNHE